MTKWLFPLATRCIGVAWLSNIVYITTSGVISCAKNSIKGLIEAHLNTGIHNKVLFFPDNSYHCGCLLSKNKAVCKCTNPTSTFQSLLKILYSAKQSLDICMFVISSRELAEVAINLHKKGVIVRVITDVEKMEIMSSQVMSFRAAGIQVRNDKSSFLMHHKFAIIDNDILVTGSFNWTYQAVTGNKENVLTTSYAPIVKPYIEEFERLWVEYNPEKSQKLP